MMTDRDRADKGLAMEHERPTCPCINPCVAHHNVLADLEARVVVVEQIQDTAPVSGDIKNLAERVARLEAQAEDMEQWAVGHLDKGHFKIPEPPDESWRD